MQGGRFARPSTRSAYTYTPPGSSPAQLASPCFGPFRYDPNCGRAWHLWSSSARCSGARPPSRSLRRRSRRLRGDTRRNASSANTPPRLATCLTAHPTNRIVACRSVRHSPPRPLPHLPIGAFFFVSLAAARQIHRAALVRCDFVRTVIASCCVGRGGSQSRPRW